MATPKRPAPNAPEPEVESAEIPSSLFPAEPDAEGEDDLGAVSADRLREAVVSSTDWTTETIIRLFDRGTIELDPAFQRRDAWTPPRKSKFIESLVMGLPIPQIVLAERKDKRGQFIVLDGKQRLLTLQQFAGNPETKGARTLKLKGITNLPQLNGKTYDTLLEDPRLAEDMEAFHTQTIRAVVVKNWPDEDFLYLVFLRLNTGSVPLAPQELRQALHPGHFVSYANRRSADCSGLQKCLRTKRPDFRMRDVELFIRYCAFTLFFKDYSGNMKVFLDDVCQKLNNTWDESETRVETIAAELDKALAFAESVFPSKNYMSVYRKSRFEQRFNRAVFDVFTYYFRDESVRTKAAGKAHRIRKAFELLCKNDSDFLESLQTTTKSMAAVEKRFSAFGFMLRKLLRIDIPVPILENGRFVT